MSDASTTVGTDPVDEAAASAPSEDDRVAAPSWLETRLTRLGFPRADAQLLTLVWAASRLWLLVVLLLVLAIKNLDPIVAISTWDVQHFLAIARNGYATVESRAFFPGLPGLMDAGAALGLRMEVVGVLVGLIGSALAGAALYRLGGGVARLGVLPAALWWLAPTTVFTFVGYTEAPFCAAAFWAWERWRKGHWLSGALLATVACTFRVSGLFLIGALMLLTLLGDNDPEQTLPDDPVERFRLLRWLLLPVAALVAHAWHLYLVTGSWMAWYNAQVSGWNRGLTSPWTAFLNTWNAAQPSAWPGRPEVPVVFSLEIVSMAVGIAATVVLVRRRKWASAGWIGVQLLAFGTSYWYMSINRAVLLWFPLWLLLAELLRGNSATRTSSANDRSSEKDDDPENDDPEKDDQPARLPLGRVLVIAAWFTISTTVAGVWAWILFTNGWAS